MATWTRNRFGVWSFPISHGEVLVYQLGAAGSGEWMAQIVNAPGFIVWQHEFTSLRAARQATERHARGLHLLHANEPLRVDAVGIEGGYSPGKVLAGGAWRLFGRIASRRARRAGRR